MRTRAVLSMCLILAGCGMPGRIQRIGVDHNTAAAGIADELTLLNILRAREDLPLHYTQINALRGILTVKGSASINDAIRQAATTDTNQTAVTTSANPTSTVATVAQQIVEGVDVITPSIGAEVTMNPSIDVIVLDSQKFYQGITGAIPYTTVQNYISQGYDQQLLMSLFIERIDFLDAEEGPAKGKRLFSWDNHDASGSKAAAFAETIKCYELSAQTQARTAVRLVPVSRLPRSATGELTGLRLEDLAALDGSKLELSAPIDADPASDAKVFVQRPRSDKGGANLSRTCPQDLATPPAEPVYLRENQAMVYDPQHRSEKVVAIQPVIVFRSTEGVIRYLGRYLRAQEENRPVALIDDKPIFSVVAGRPRGSIVTASVLGRRYSITEENRRRNMLVIALVEQLVNLHKESSDRPVTTPVQVLGGG
jgi:hypothetical protein